MVANFTLGCFLQLLTLPSLTSPVHSPKTLGFPQALLDILTAFLHRKRFLHHKHHFYILYNIMADDKSILLIAHPACYNSHKKTQAAGKAMRWCQIIFLVSKQKQKYFPGAGESQGSYPGVEAAANRSLTSHEMVNSPVLWSTLHPHLSPRRDGRHLEHPHVVCWEARRMNAKNGQDSSFSSWVHFCITQVVSMFLPFTTNQPMTFAQNANWMVPQHNLLMTHLQSCC